MCRRSRQAAHRNPCQRKQRTVATCDVPRDTRTTQSRSRQSDRDRFFDRNHTDANRATKPDSIFRKHRFVFIKALRKVVDELANVAD